MDQVPRGLKATIEGGGKPKGDFLKRATKTQSQPKIYALGNNKPKIMISIKPKEVFFSGKIQNSSENDKGLSTKPKVIISNAKVQNSSEVGIGKDLSIERKNVLFDKVIKFGLNNIKANFDSKSIIINSEVASTRGFHCIIGCIRFCSKQGKF